ncbi:MAG: tetratricopeptide repeat protein [Calditrichaeota bacterium]|nr:tetratricopeptide repeat protein [Calditrichota bacterium]
MASTSELLSTAIELHQMGMYDQASKVCQQILQQQANHVQALHLLGLLRYRQNQFAEALRLLQQAVQIQQNAGIYLTLGNVLNAMGQPEKAIICFRTACKLDPGTIEAWINLGILLFDLGKYRESIEALNFAHQRRPEQPLIPFYLGNNYYNLKDYERALQYYQEVLRLDPQFPTAEFYLQLGNTYTTLEKPVEALKAYRKAAELKPDMASAYNNMGSTLVTLGKIEEALGCYHISLQIDPGHVETYFNLGNALRMQGKLEEAAANYRKAIQIKPNYYKAQYNLGKVLTDLGHLEEGLSHFLKTIEIQPDMLAARVNAAYVYQELLRVEDALECLEAGLTVDPNHIELRWNRALLLLLLGRYKEGWQDYELRWKRGKLKPRPFDQPTWDGRPLPDGRLLIYCEQGLGDCLQFIRYLPMVKERVGQVILECPRSLKRLLAGLPEIDTLVVAGDPLPPFDEQIALLSLPRVFQTTVDTIPNHVPYLSIPAEALENMRKHMSPGNDRLKVGIVWRGNPRHLRDSERSCSLEYFQTLLDIPEIQWFSLQKGQAEEELTRHFPDGEIINLSPHLNDFADTAAAIALLDLVISVDTSVAHLAGALAKPVWILLPFSPDWRWLLHRKDSPWYPTARLFRQPARRDWTSVFQEVKAELLKQVKPRSPSKD